MILSGALGYPLLARRRTGGYLSPRAPGGPHHEGSDAAMTSTAATEWTSPLRAIERAAQEAAKAEALDMGEPGARQQLRALLDEQVARWQADYRRGLRPLDIADPEAAV